MPEENRVADRLFLGADFALDAASGRYKFATVFAGDNTRDKYRVAVDGFRASMSARASILLAVDGQELKAPTDPYSLLVGKAGRNDAADGG